MRRGCVLAGWWDTRGVFSHVLAALLRNGSKPMVLIGLPNVPPVFLVLVLVLLSLRLRTLHGDVGAIYAVDRLVYIYPLNAIPSLRTFGYRWKLAPLSLHSSIKFIFRQGPIHFGLISHIWIAEFYANSYFHTRNKKNRI